MKIAVIAKAAVNSKTYTSHHKQVTYHSNNLFLSEEDKSALEYALQLIEQEGGTIDAYTFEQDQVAERVLHEALALGADKAIKITAGDVNDPLQQNYIAQEFVHYLKEQDKNYDLILAGCTGWTELSAMIATQLGSNYYDHLSAIDAGLNFEMKLEQGAITGKCKLPAVITVLSSVSVSHLAGFSALNQAINTSITAISFNKLPKQKTSSIIAKDKRPQKEIFDLTEDPQATQKLVAALRQDGILR